MVLHEHKSNISKPTRVMFGTFSGMVATTMVHPLDAIKIRLQIHLTPGTTRSLASKIIQYEGIFSLYTGLSSGLLRQATNTTTRLTVFYWLRDIYKEKYQTHPSVGVNISIGIVAGLAGAFAGNPSEICLVRIIADGPKAPGENIKRNTRYCGAFNTMSKIFREEGLVALWRGGTLTLIRSVLVSIAQIGYYTHAKEHLVKKNVAQEGYLLHAYTVTLSTLLTTLVSLPVDLVKTRYQVKVGVPLRDIFSYILKNKGLKYFWKGFFPYYIRMSIHTFVTYIMMDNLEATYHDYLEDKKTR